MLLKRWCNTAFFCNIFIEIGEKAPFCPPLAKHKRHRNPHENQELYNPHVSGLKCMDYSFFLSMCAKIPARIVPLMEW